MIIFQLLLSSMADMTDDHEAVVDVVVLVVVGDGGGGCDHLRFCVEM